MPDQKTNGKQLTKEDKLTVLQALRMVSNSVLLDRSRLQGKLGTQFDGDRELYKVLGYKDNPDIDDYLHKYQRQDIAKRIINLPPQYTWRNVTGLLEEKEVEDETPFEKAWEDFNRRIHAVHYMERADRLAGLGRYSILLIGVNSPGSLQTPLRESSLKSQEDVIYLKSYGEKRAKIEAFDEKTNSPRFGKPDLYKVDLAGDLQSVGTGLKEQLVHHSRIIHIAEDLLEDDIYGTPRLESVINLLYDLIKVVGGSAEMFWQGAYKGLHLDVRTEQGLGQLSDDELAGLSDEIDEYVHGIRRFIRTQGVDINPLEAELGNPEYSFNAIISLLSGAVGIPKRVLIGSERGELASTQDEQNLAAFIRDRRDQYAEPTIFRPLVDKLIELGALPNPEGGYEIKWPPLSQLTPVQEAQRAESYARAIRFASGNKAPKEDLIVSEQEFRTQYLGLSPQRLDEHGRPVDSTKRTPVEDDEPVEDVMQEDEEME